MLKSLFGKTPDVKEQVRESKREMRKGEREIQREIVQLQIEEKKTILEIKASTGTSYIPRSCMHAPRGPSACRHARRLIWWW